MVELQAGISPQDYRQAISRSFEQITPETTKCFENYGRKLKAQIEMLIDKWNTSVEGQDIEKILSIIDRYLDVELYLHEYSYFIEATVINLSRTGLQCKADDFHASPIMETGHKSTMRCRVMRLREEIEEDLLIRSQVIPTETKITSNNQSGGITAQNVIIGEKSRLTSTSYAPTETGIPLKKIMTWVGGFVGFIASVFGILDYFNITLWG
jgi:hypothetical protein